MHLQTLDTCIATEQEESVWEVVDKEEGDKDDQEQLLLIKFKRILYTVLNLRITVTSFSYWCFLFVLRYLIIFYYVHSALYITLIEVKKKLWIHLKYFLPTIGPGCCIFYFLMCLKHFLWWIYFTSCVYDMITMFGFEEMMIWGESLILTEKSGVTKLHSALDLCLKFWETGWRFQEMCFSTS